MRVETQRAGILRTSRVRVETQRAGLLRTSRVRVETQRAGPVIVDSERPGVRGPGLIVAPEPGAAYAAPGGSELPIMDRAGRPVAPPSRLGIRQPVGGCRP